MRLRHWTILLAILTPANATGQVARPAESPGSWINNKDYPTSALRAFEEGRVTFSLDVDATGAPTHCTIVTSSGSPALDEGTCRAFMKRSKFIPPVDDAGKPIKGYFSSRISWVMPFPFDIDPKKNYIGVIGHDEQKKGETRVVVEDVLSGPGLQAGLKSKDIILKVNNHIISNFSDFARFTNSIPIGKTYAVTIDRNSTVLTLIVKSQPLPPEGTPEHYAVKRQMWEAYFRR